MDLTRTSANISNDRKVVLTALREVPEEVNFMLSEAEQDPNIPNRYWFNLPIQWATQPNKDPIIGIRDIYTTNTNRFIRYSYKFMLNDLATQPIDPSHSWEPIDTIEGVITHWIDGNETISKITEQFNNISSSNNWLTNSTVKRTHSCSDEEHTWSQYEIACYYGCDRDDKTTYLYFGRITLDDPFYTTNNNKHYPYSVEITPLSDDCMALFGTTTTLRAEPDETQPCRVKIPVWSRHQCLVKSSIATNDKNNILGHTRNDPYMPIKYYRMINSSVKKFWIELYETRYHESPVVFPTKVYETDEDKKKELDRDDLIIEAIVCFTAQAMI